MFLARRCNISNSPGLIRVYFRIGGLPRFETNWGEKKNGICLHNESHLCKLSNFVGDYSDPHHNILVLDDSTGRRPAKKENLAEASSWYHSREFFLRRIECISWWKIISNDLTWQIVRYDGPEKVIPSWHLRDGDGNGVHYNRAHAYVYSDGRAENDDYWPRPESDNSVQGGSTALQPTIWQDTRRAAVDFWSSFSWILWIVLLFVSFLDYFFCVVSLLDCFQEYEILSDLYRWVEARSRPCSVRTVSPFHRWSCSRSCTRSWWRWLEVWMFRCFNFQMFRCLHTNEQYSHEDLDEEPDEGVVGHAVVHDSTKRRIHRDRTGHRWWWKPS